MATTTCCLHFPHTHNTNRDPKDKKKIAQPKQKTLNNIRKRIQLDFVVYTYVHAEYARKALGMMPQKNITKQWETPPNQKKPNCNQQTPTKKQKDKKKRQTHLSSYQQSIFHVVN